MCCLNLNRRQNNIFGARFKNNDYVPTSNHGYWGSGTLYLQYVSALLDQVYSLPKVSSMFASFDHSNHIKNSLPLNFITYSKKCWQYYCLAIIVWCMSVQVSQNPLTKKQKFSLLIKQLFQFSFFIRLWLFE